MHALSLRSNARTSSRQPNRSGLPRPAVPLPFPPCCWIFLLLGPVIAAEGVRRALTWAWQTITAASGAAAAMPGNTCRASLPTLPSCSPLHDAAQAGNADLIRQLLTPPPETKLPSADDMVDPASGAACLFNCSFCCSAALSFTAALTCWAASVACMQIIFECHQFWDRLFPF